MRSNCSIYSNLYLYSGVHVKIRIVICIDMNKNKEFEVFGLYRKICSKHAKTETAIKECLIGQIAEFLQDYGSKNYNDLTQSEIAIKDRIMNCIKIGK